VLAAVAATVALIVVAGVAFAGGGHGLRTKERSLRDSTQLRQIHQVLIIFAREMDGRMPRPGLIDRLPTEVDGVPREIPGRGEEDVAQNTTAALYSLLVVQNWITPELPVSPVERNPRVAVCAAFDFDSYNPVEDVYWDPGFRADLAEASHASYAHLPMFGKRMEHQWRDSLLASEAVLGNRGPQAGEPDGASYTCGPHGHWAGNIVFNDNHTELLSSMTRDALRLPSGEPDNLFAMETGPAGGDAVLAFTKSMDPEKGPTLQYD
jgi:hypothetical protein